MIETISTLSAKWTWFGNPNVLEIGLHPNLSRLEYARHLGTTIMFLTLVLAVVAAVYNRCGSNVPQKSQMGQYQLETNDIERSITTNQQKQNLESTEENMTEEERLLNQAEPQEQSYQRKIDFGLISGFLRNQFENQNTNGIEKYGCDLNESQSSEYSVSGLSAAMMSDSQSSCSNSDCIPRNSYNSQRSHTNKKPKDLNYDVHSQYSLDEDQEQLYLDIEPEVKYNSYSIKEQELFQQDAVPPLEDESHAHSEYITTVQPTVPVHKQIPKIALNFTKWKLQKNMVNDLRQLTDQNEISKKILKYTECFELLDKLGADNCVDPEDFDQEDLDDDLFKNLQISDIEELFNEDKKYSFVSIGEPDSKIEQDTPYSAIDEKCRKYACLSDSDGPLSDSDHLILEQDSEYRHEDLELMDFDEQMKMYEQMQEEDDKVAKENQLNKFKIQGLEEVLEQSEESDMTSQLSYISAGGFSSTSSVDSSDSETAARIKMNEYMPEIESKAIQVFKSAPIPFTFDFEDYENCKLNGELKKLIVTKRITLPIVPIKNTSQYFFGVQKINLEWKNKSIWADNSQIKFSDFVDHYEKPYQKQLAFYMIKSGWTIEKVVQSLLDQRPINNVTKRDVKLLKSYTEVATAQTTRRSASSMKHHKSEASYKKFKNTPSPDRTNKLEIMPQASVNGFSLQIPNYQQNKNLISF